MKEGIFLCRDEKEEWASLMREGGGASGMEEKDEERIMGKEWNTDGKREWKKVISENVGDWRAEKCGHEIKGAPKMRRRRYLIEWQE